MYACSLCCLNIEQTSGYPNVNWKFLFLKMLPQLGNTQTGTELKGKHCEAAVFCACALKPVRLT